MKVKAITLPVQEWTKALGVTVLTAGSRAAKSSLQAHYRSVFLRQTTKYLDVVATTGSWLTRWRTPPGPDSGKTSLQCQCLLDLASAKRMLRDAKECHGVYRRKRKADRGPSDLDMTVYPESPDGPVYVHHLGTGRLEAVGESPFWTENYEKVLKDLTPERDHDLESLAVGIGRMADICKILAAAMGKSPAAAYREGMLVKRGSSAEAGLEITLKDEPRLTIILMPMRV